MRTYQNVVARTDHVPWPRRDLLAPGFSATPDHNLVYNGGKTIPDLRYVMFYLGGVDSWIASDYGSINTNLSAALSDPALTTIIQQYFKTPIATEFQLAQYLPGAKPATFTQGDLEALIGSLYRNGTINANNFDLSKTAFCFLLPQGSILTTDPGVSSAKTEIARQAVVRPEDKDTSLQGLGGYHGSVHPIPGLTIYYAIVVYSAKQPDGSENGIVAFDQPWKNVVATLYHELNEIRTDPDVEDVMNGGSNGLLGWMSAQGEEIGDFPVFEAGSDLSEVMLEIPLSDGNGTVPVQLMYSNADSGPGYPVLTPKPVQPQGVSLWTVLIRFLHSLPLIGRFFPVV